MLTIPRNTQGGERGIGCHDLYYTGPEDVQSGFQFFRLCRAFSAAKAGTKAYNIARANDSTSLNVSSL
jgi:hypothetical protein